MKDLGEQNLNLRDQATKAARDAATKIEFDVQKPEGQPGEANISVDTEIKKKRFTFGFGAWFKRKFTHGGSSVGGKGKIEWR